MKKRITILLLALVLIASAFPAMSVAEDVPTLKMFINASTAPIDNWGKDPVSIKIMEKAGVNVVLDKPSSDDNQRLNLMLASGSDVPDMIVYGKTNSAFADMVEAGMLYTLDELIEKYEPEFKDDPYYKSDWERIQYSDGNVYYIPAWASPKQFEDTGAYIFGRNGYYLRGDIYEAIGSPDLETLDDLKYVLEEVKAAYPDLKGLQLWNAVNAPMDSTSGVIMFYYSMGGQYNYYWKEDGETLSPYFTSDLYKDTLVYLNELNQIGAINPNDFSRDYTQLEIDGNNGTFFMGVGALYECLDGNGAVGQNVPGAYYTPANFLTGNGEEVLVPAALRLGGDGICITKNCSDPEAAFRFVRFLMGEEGNTLALVGEKGVHWDWVEEGKALLGLGEWKDLCASDWTAWTETLGTYKYTWAVNDYYDCCFAWGLASSSQERLDVYTMESMTRDSTPYEDLLPLGGTDEEVIWVKIQAQWERYIPKLILAADMDEFDAIWDEYIQTLDELGIEEIEAYVTNRYHEKNG